MAYVTLNGVDVIETKLSLPRFGVWHADLIVDALEEPSGTMLLMVGNIAYLGYIRRAGLCAGAMQVLMVGGKGGLGKTVVSPRAYKNVPIKLPFLDVLTEAKEELSSKADTGFTGFNLPFWATRQTKAGVALSALTGAVADASWRTLRDAKVWAGVESWPKQDNPEVINEDPRNLRTICEIAPWVQPGTTVLGGKTSYVEHLVGEKGLHTHVWFER